MQINIKKNGASKVQMTNPVIKLATKKQHITLIMIQIIIEINRTTKEQIVTVIQTSIKIIKIRIKIIPKIIIMQSIKLKQIIISRIKQNGVEIKHKTKSTIRAKVKKNKLNIKTKNAI